jgi:hypothetical protein
MSLHGKTHAQGHPENQNIKLCWYENTVMKNYQGKGKGNVCPRTGHEGPEGE